MTNPYPRYIPDETCPGVEVENPQYVAWDEGYETARQKVETINRSGFWNDWSGATHRVEILAETTDGQYVVHGDSLSLGLSLSLVKKEDIALAQEGE